MRVITSQGQLWVLCGELVLELTQFDSWDDRIDNDNGLLSSLDSSGAVLLSLAAV